MKTLLKKEKYLFFLAQLSLFPLVGEARTVRSIAENIAKFLLGPLLTFLTVLALVLFITGVVEFMRNAENSDARKRGKEKILWGIIALFVMLGFISITGVFTRTFFGGNPILPQLYE